MMDDLAATAAWPVRVARLARSAGPTSEPNCPTDIARPVGRPRCHGRPPQLTLSADTGATAGWPVRLAPLSRPTDTASPVARPAGHAAMAAWHVKLDAWLGRLARLAIPIVQTDTTSSDGLPGRPRCHC